MKINYIFQLKKPFINSLHRLLPKLHVRREEEIVWEIS